MIPFSDNWEFTPEWTEDFANGKGISVPVRLPHTVREVPLHYADDASYQMVSGYRKTVILPEDQKDDRVFVQFDGAAHIATVYLDGRELYTHRCGYTMFRVELTGLLTPGQPAILSVRLDSTENPAVPPFGFVIDYLTYGGLYRPCWLEYTARDRIADVYVTTPDLTHARVRITLDRQEEKPLTVRMRIRSADGTVLVEEAGSQSEFNLPVPNAAPWTLDSPALYDLDVFLEDESGRVLDSRTAAFGFRTIEFRFNGFYLNGSKVFLRGLNRHQAYPYIGYAAPDSLQAEDARILKEELGLTIVRTSHYPQSQAFIDACDRLGLLVFTEIPGWQHIGDEQWKDQAVENVREMVTQYRNHPSVILWGVRINESLDDDAFYERTNQAAHELDDSRPTSGVRYLQKSHLLEDVYAFNDFSHTGKNAGVLHKKDVTPQMNKALLISEHNGHMFPTKAGDTWEKRQEHALRHARVLNDAMADGLHAGCIGWCMFDYPTHKDFGSGDRVCYHGVMDAFRNPKLAAALYQSQQDETPVLAVSSSMDIGDYPAGNIGTVYVFSNADRVDLYKDDEFIVSLPASRYQALPHDPRALEDTIGNQLREKEGFTGSREKLLHRCLLYAKKHGVDKMPLREKAGLAWCRLRYGMTRQDFVRLYNKYVASWGDRVTRWRFEAVKDGQSVASYTCCPSARLHLEAKVSADTLREGATYDMALVRLRIADENGNTAVYDQIPLSFHLSGAAELVGPTAVTAEGGMAGTLVRSVGQSGDAVLTVIGAGMAPLSLSFHVVCGESGAEGTPS